MFFLFSRCFCYFWSKTKTRENKKHKKCNTHVATSWCVRVCNFVFWFFCFLDVFATKQKTNIQNVSFFLWELPRPSTCKNWLHHHPVCCVRETNSKHLCFLSAHFLSARTDTSSVSTVLVSVALLGSFAHALRYFCLSVCTDLLLICFIAALSQKLNSYVELYCETVLL